eukprot:1979033-Rhodomonas_salina.1
MYPATSLCRCCAMSGTDVAYAATRRAVHRTERKRRGTKAPLSCYAFAMPCPVLSYAGSGTSCFVRRGLAGTERGSSYQDF